MTRRFTTRRRISLSDTDARGRLRLDAIARYLQDAATEDWLDAGFDLDAHVWVVRRTELDQLEPFAPEAAVSVETWCSGVSGSAAARRYSVRGDTGGRLEADSIWIHLDHDLRPKRLDERFLDVYGESASGRRAPTRFTLPSPGQADGVRWRFRPGDVDRLGHVNNAAYWVPLDELWKDADVAVQLHRFQSILEYRQPIDVEDAVVLVEDGRFAWLLVDGEVRAAARYDATP